MTVPSTVRRAGPFYGTGLSVNYPFTFKVFTKEDVEVTLSVLATGVDTVGVLDSDYRVVLNVDQDATPGGYVAYEVGGVDTPLPATLSLTVTGLGLEYEQGADLPQGGNFDATVVENALDNLEMQIQNLRDQVGLAVRLSVASPPGFSAQFPAPVPLNLLGWDAGGLQIVNYNGAATAPVVAAQLTQLVADLASTASSTLGAGKIGAGLPSLNYAAGTLGAALHDGVVNVMWFLTAAERTQVKANGTTLDLTPKINAAKTWAGNRPLYLPGGTWSFTGFDGKGWYGGLVGDGVGVTILKVRAAVTNAIDFNEVADVIISPFLLRDLTLDGNGLATNGINVRYRHQSVMENVYVIGCIVWGIIEKDAWNSRRHNVRTTSNPNGHWLVGSNHGSVFSACVWSGGSGIQLRVQTAGTAADGNSGLLFDNCQAVDGTGQGVDIDCSSAVFNGCYLGENIGGVTMVARGGAISINSGTLFFGSTAVSYMFAPVGGRVIATGAKINGQTFGSTALLNSTNTGGKWSLRDCESAMLVGGDQVLLGDVLDYGPPGLVFSKRLGRNLTSSANNATRTELLSGNAITCTCTAAPGPTPNITVTATLTGTPPEWRVGENLYLVVVYLSNAAFSVRFSGGAFGGAPTAAIGTMPNTGSLVRTYVKIDGVIASAAYDRIEFYRDNCAVNDFLKIEEVFIADSRMLNKGAGVIGNLYKC